MAVSKHYCVSKKGDCYAFSNHGKGYEFPTRESAVEFGSDFASANDVEVVIYEAVAAIKPERAPVSVTTL